MEVTWIATCGDAVPNGATLDYTAPEEVMDCDVTATSVLDASMSATAQVSVRSAGGVTAADDTDDGACTWEHCSFPGSDQRSQRRP